MEGTITVLIEDDPEAPVFNTPAVMSIVENEPAGNTVGPVVVSDPDLDDHLDIVLHEPTESFVLGKPTCVNDVSESQGDKVGKTLEHQRCKCVLGENLRTSMMLV